MKIGQYLFLVRTVYTWLFYFIGEKLQRRKGVSNLCSLNPTAPSTAPYPPWPEVLVRLPPPSPHHCCC